MRNVWVHPHWEPVDVKEDSRIGVNSPKPRTRSIASVRVRHLDGASTWKFLD